MKVGIQDNKINIFFVDKMMIYLEKPMDSRQTIRIKIFLKKCSAAALPITRSSYKNDQNI